jgi:hypothetical protein
MPRLTPAERFLRAHRRKPAGSEAALQAAVVKWCDGIGKGFVRGRFFAIPNGAQLTGGGIAWARLRATGARAGVPDMAFYRSDGRFLFVELKNGTSHRLTDAQQEWLTDLAANNVLCACCRSLAETVDTITRFYMPAK